MSKEVVVLCKKDGSPFVVKKTKYYYIENVKYTDDVKILLNAIKQVKEVKYDDLFKPEHGTNKQDFWNVYFNYQWSGGGLILWHNPTELWEQELSRKGKLNCKVCGTKMHMYYIPYCPMCDRAEELRKSNPKYNLIKMITFIQTKYNIDIRDYATKKFNIVGSSTHYNCEHENKWKLNHYPILETFRDTPEAAFNETGNKFYNSKEGKEFFNKMQIEYDNAPDGKCKEIPYWDWWHKFIDVYDFRNDCKITINFKHLLDRCGTNWQKEITQLFIDEYGTKDIEVEISW